MKTYSALQAYVAFLLIWGVSLGHGHGHDDNNNVNEQQQKGSGVGLKRVKKVTAINPSVDLVEEGRRYQRRAITSIMTAAPTINAVEETSHIKDKMDPVEEADYPVVPPDPSDLLVIIDDPVVPLDGVEVIDSINTPVSEEESEGVTDKSSKSSKSKKSKSGYSSPTGSNRRWRSPKSVKTDQSQKSKKSAKNDRGWGRFDTTDPVNTCFISNTVRVEVADIPDYYDFNGIISLPHVGVTSNPTMNGKGSITLTCNGRFDVRSLSAGLLVDPDTVLETRKYQHVEDPPNLLAATAFVAIDSDREQIGNTFIYYYESDSYNKMYCIDGFPGIFNNIEALEIRPLTPDSSVRQIVGDINITLKTLEEESAIVPSSKSLDFVGN